MKPLTKDKIRTGFSNSAGQYDIYADLHRQIADRLLAEVTKKADRPVILDVGCGTGYLTGKLKKQFPQGNIIGLDFAQGMLEVARSKGEDVNWVLANGDNLPFANMKFDIVTSNLAYQWTQDLTCAFSECLRVLKPGGRFICTLFGRYTCQELFQSLDEASGKALKFTRLPDQHMVREALLSSGFKGPQVDSEMIKEEFIDMMELVTWFKYIGAPHLPRDGYLGPESLSRAAGIYQKKFAYRQGVGATFEVIKVYAKR